MNTHIQNTKAAQKEGLQMLAAAEQQESSGQLSSWNRAKRAHSESKRGCQVTSFREMCREVRQLSSAVVFPVPWPEGFPSYL